MKRVLLTVAVFLASLVLIAGPASAKQNCSTSADGLVCSGGYGSAGGGTGGHSTDNYMGTNTFSGGAGFGGFGGLGEHCTYTFDTADCVGGGRL